MDKYEELITSLKGLVGDNTSPEEAEKIGGLVTKINDLKTDHDTLITKHEELRGKYVQSITQSAFKGEGDSGIKEDPKPKTLEECIEEASKEK